MTAWGAPSRPGDSKFYTGQKEFTPWVNDLMWKSRCDSEMKGMMSYLDTIAANNGSDSARRRLRARHGNATDRSGSTATGSGTARTYRTGSSTYRTGSSSLSSIDVGRLEELERQLEREREARAVMERRLTRERGRRSEAEADFERAQMTQSLEAERDSRLRMERELAGLREELMAERNARERIEQTMGNMMTGRSRGSAASSRGDGAYSERSSRPRTTSTARRSRRDY